MPRPQSLATDEIVSQLKSGVQPRELAKQYPAGVVYRIWHRLMEGDDGGSSPGTPSSPSSPPHTTTATLVEERKVRMNPPPRGKHNIITPGGGSIGVTDSIYDVPLAQAMAVNPRVLRLPMPIYLFPAYHIATTKWGWPRDMPPQDFIDTIFKKYFELKGWILGPGAFHIEDLKELLGMKYLDTDTGELTSMAEVVEEGKDAVCPGTLRPTESGGKAEDARGEEAKVEVGANPEGQGGLGGTQV